MPLKKCAAECLIFLLFFFAGSYFYHPVDYDNTSSRLYLVSSIVDFGVLHIDPYAAMTTDKSRGVGHFYSNKAIGAPLLAVPVYWLHRKIAPWSDSLPLTRAMRYVIRLFAATLPFAFLGVMLFRVAGAWSGDGKKALLAVLAYGMGTIALIHAGLLSGHGTAAAFSFFAFGGLVYLKAKYRKSSVLIRGPSPEAGPGGFSVRAPVRSREATSHLILAALTGISAGFAALCDYTAAYTAGLLAVYAIVSPMPKRFGIAFIAGGLLCALALAAYNWQAFGSPFSLSYGHLVTERFSQPSKEGFLGVTLPKPHVLIALLFSPGRGLFAVMPVLAFSVLGLWNMLRRTSLRGEALMILLIALGYMMINGGFYGWHGGWTYGPRYLTPMLPFLALTMVFAPRAPLLFWASMAVSVLQVNQAAAGLPHTPEQILNPLVELIIPCMGQGYLAETWPGWLGLPARPAIALYAVTAILLSWLAWSVVAKENPFSHPGGDRETRCPDRDFMISTYKDSAFRRQPEERASPIREWSVRLCIGVWLGLIALMLNGIHTRPPSLVRYYQARLIFHLQKKDAIYDRVQRLAEAYRKDHDPSAD